jgi:hypothetical protein
MIYPYMIFEQIFYSCLTVFEEKLNKLFYQLNISRPYRISARAIWYSAGYRISKKAGFSGRMSGASLFETTDLHNFAAFY